MYNILTDSKKYLHYNYLGVNVWVFSFEFFQIGSKQHLKINTTLYYLLISINKSISNHKSDVIYFFITIVYALNEQSGNILIVGKYFSHYQDKNEFNIFFYNI
jgi:hypothetical protein